MRITKVENVRIGDFIATALVNGYPADFYGVVTGIVHMSANVVKFTVQYNDGPFGVKSESRTFVLGSETIRRSAPPMR